jgi:hypothetical protein
MLKMKHSFVNLHILQTLSIIILSDNYQTPTSPHLSIVLTKPTQLITHVSDKINTLYFTQLNESYKTMPIYK